MRRGKFGASANVNDSRIGGQLRSELAAAGIPLNSPLLFGVGGGLDRPVKRRITFLMRAGVAGSIFFTHGVR